MSCSEKLGNSVESAISGFFSRIGKFVGSKPEITIVLGIVVTAACGVGFRSWTTENRPFKLWVPQNTQAEKDAFIYRQYFDSNVRFNTMTVQPKNSGENVLSKELLLVAMDMHYAIQTGNSTTDGETNTLTSLCVNGNSCRSSGPRGDICPCLVDSILSQWNYDRSILEADEDYMSTLNTADEKKLAAILGLPTFDNGNVIAAEAFKISYFLADRLEIIDNAESDPINDAWEEQVFLETARSVPTAYSQLKVDYFAARSFNDEFGNAITGDLALVQISYVMAFLFLGATMGRIVCGTGSRWTMALAAMVTVILSTAAGFGISSLAGLFFGPVHSLLPFILLGIGVDDAFVIVNAFNRERKLKRTAESNTELANRAARSLARAGASITVTSATDLVAFAISSSSALPALASFCGYAAICIFFLWFFAATFFSGCMVLDERRQRDNRRECLCCVTRKKPLEEGDEDGFEEDALSRYFRNYHAPAILSSFGKMVVILAFSGLLGYGVYGAINLPVEDTQRAFIPADSYVQDWFKSSDSYFPSSGIDLYFLFENSTEIYGARGQLANFSSRLTGLSDAAPFIAEPNLNETYQNVIDGYFEYLQTTGGENNILGEDGWPKNETEFTSSLKNFVTNPLGFKYVTDVAFLDDGMIGAIRIKSQYVGLTKLSRDKIIDDADRQIQAMDQTRELIESWKNSDLGITNIFPYSEKFISIEGFKVIREELFLNLSLSIAAVALIVFLTVASAVTALLITMSVAFCLVEILGFMYLLGIAIDSVSVINIVLAVGLSVDYSAHVGHCFMTKGGEDKNQRALEALADIGAAVLNGATSTFLAVAVLLFSSSYVFSVLSKQFALTVGLGILHGLVLLPVLLSLFGPKPFASAEDGYIDAKGAISEETSDKDITEINSGVNGANFNGGMVVSSTKSVDIYVNDNNPVVSSNIERSDYDEDLEVEC